MDAITETSYLLSNEANAEHLKKSIAQHKSGKVKSRTLSKKYDGKMITEKLNEVYDKIDQSDFEAIANVVLESMREITKNDTW
jgi:hypothetical protein